MLTAAANLRSGADLILYDFLDRNSPDSTNHTKSTTDKWGRGHFQGNKIEKPKQFASIPRIYRRFGTNRSTFQAFLKKNTPFDLTEPLNHNKTAFPIIHLGQEKINHFKSLCKKLNRNT